MEDIKVKRNKKSDKAKKNVELNGGKSQKHVRLAEQVKTAETKKK
jgi:hypothetical protein